MTLSPRALNRALLARQLLLERADLPIPEVLERIGGIQAQYAPASYIRLWAMLSRFGLSDLDRELEARTVVQGTLMRSTIHLVSARDWWPFAQGIGPSRQGWWHRTWGREFTREELDRMAAQLDAELAGRTWPRKELDELMRSHHSTVWSGAWVALIRVPPSGTWARRRADLFQRAAEWIGPPDCDEASGLTHLLRRYLGAFGPARLADAANWAGVAVSRMQAAASTMDLVRFRDEGGRELLDLPDAPRPDPATPAPVRFLPVWDATLLVHARRTQILPEAHRPLVFNTKTPHSVHTFVVDGQVAGTWKVEQDAGVARLAYTPFAPLPANARSELEAEAANLVRLMEPDAEAHRVESRATVS